MERVFKSFPRLKERLSQLGGTLSGGEQQMLAIGRGMMAQPKLLLLDEPSMGLAPILVEEIFSIIQEINAQGVSILLVEQNALMALSVAHRGYVLETGRIVLTGTGRGAAARSAGDERVSGRSLGTSGASYVLAPQSGLTIVTQVVNLRYSFQGACMDLIQLTEPPTSSAAARTPGWSSRTTAPS